MKLTHKLGLTVMLALMITIIPVMAGNDNGQYPNGNDNQNEGNNNNQPIDIDINNPLNIDVDNTFSPDITVDNVNKNYNTNNNYVDQSQKQHQKQSQSQTQSNVQTVSVSLPHDANGILVSGISNALKAPIQLDVGESKVFSRLMYPGEVLPFEVQEGNIISVRSASDVGIYTIGNFYNDILKINSMESVPTYDPFYHRMEFGIVVPVDKIDYWTTKATLKAGSGATYVVVDNRAPWNAYTHIEVAIDNVQPRKVVTPSNVTAPIPVISVYPVDENNYGMANTSS